MEAKIASGAGFLTRLSKDQRGTTLAMMGMALIPIAAMIGSGLDISRAYLVKAKLQTACDAAALATRRYMASAALTQPAKDEGKKFFDFNFPSGTMGTSAVTPTIGTNATDASVVEVSARTSVPTTLMAMFGQPAIPVSANCSADQDYVNNDIMLVLDVTGSMNCSTGTGDGCLFQPSEQPNSRIAALKTAAAALYKALAGATGVRTRYGFMPYSMTVNVAGDLDKKWLRTTGTYHYYCASATSTAPCTSKGWHTKTQTEPLKGAPNCIEERSDVGGAAWPIRMSSLVSQDDIDMVDVTGSNTALQWQYYDSTTTFGQSNSAFGNKYSTLINFCPAAAKKLAVYQKEQDYTDQVTASVAQVGGYTNHELGIMWAMRYLSSTGMFAAQNPTMLNNIRVDKHIVFLTDGEMMQDDANYSSFGIPNADDRLSGGGARIDKHKARFLAACNRARQMGATIWVIALDTGATADIAPCASGSDHFYTATTSAQLETVFSLIGKGIGKLRITR
jgi:Flp pilus assembly protein TadG